MDENNTPVVETTEEIVETVTETVEAPAAAPAPVVEEESANVEVPAKFKSIVEAIEEMSVLDLNELVKLFEKKFGVSAAAVAVAGPAAAAAEEKSEFTVVLTADGGAKIGVMKVVKEALGLGLKEAKDLVDGIPSTLKENMKKEDAEALKAAIEAAGGKVELK
jgi:large subunit ribosomal protein L7/L12